MAILNLRARIGVVLVAPCAVGGLVSGWLCAEAGVSRALWIALAGTGAGAVIAVVGAIWLLHRLRAETGAITCVVEAVHDGMLSTRVESVDFPEFEALRAALNQLFGDIAALAAHARSSGDRVGSTLIAMSLVSRQQQSAAGEIASATARIGSSARKITETADGLMRTVSEVGKLASVAAESADRGKSGVQRMEQSIQQIAEASAAIGSKLAVLNERAANISSVVTTISKVADQTNLLSFNAAIEAEKAGEFGLGFAVVATEIRRLADQTAIATRDIEKMVREIQSAVSAGVMGMDKFGEEVRRGVGEIGEVNGQLTQIIHQVKALAPRFSTVSGGVQAQMSGAGEISEVLNLFDAHARRTEYTVQQAGRAIELLQEASAGLQDGTARFRSAA